MNTQQTACHDLKRQTKSVCDAAMQAYDESEDRENNVRERRMAEQQFFKLTALCLEFTNTMHQCINATRSTRNNNNATNG